jgi:hypothetical protein
MIITSITYSVEFLMGILAYMSVGYLNPGAIPPKYNPMYDLNGDGWIGVQDILICLANM